MVRAGRGNAMELRCFPATLPSLRPAPGWEGKGITHSGTRRRKTSCYLTLLKLGVTFPASYECLASHPSSFHWEWLWRKVQGSSISKERWVKHLPTKQQSACWLGHLPASQECCPCTLQPSLDTAAPSTLLGCDSSLVPQNRCPCGIRWHKSSTS